ncbi:MAG: rhomboid family intramembrane serine protease [Armatimonadetes bacterium]|nr:rhomboid family intramembrane serine protease [Armatimonadota bacterium]
MRLRRRIMTNPGNDIPSVGASGAIAAVLGAYLVTSPRSRINVLVIIGIFIRVARVTAIVFLGIWAITQFLTGIASLGTPTAQTIGVAWWAHIGGFVFGLIAGAALRSRAARLEIAEA